MAAGCSGAIRAAGGNWRKIAINSNAAVLWPLGGVDLALGGGTSHDPADPVRVGAKPGPPSLQG